MSFKAGFDARALERVESSLREDVERGLIDGAVIKVARHGEVVLDSAVGYADRHAAVPMREDSVFKVLSLTKAFTTTLVLEAIDLGLLSLTTRVVDVIPEFWGRDLFRSGRKERVNVGHLLTHRAGLSPTPQPLPYDRLHVLSETIQAVCELDVVGEPGKAFSYSPTVNHALLGEMVRRVHGAESFADLLDKRLFRRLGMASTSLGTNSPNRSAPCSVDFQLPRRWLVDQC